MISLKAQLDDAVKAISAHVSAFGPTLAEDAIRAASEVHRWILYFDRVYPVADASPLLDGARAAILESVSYIALGMGRAAVSSIRTQIDLILAFTFFCDHPREWSTVLDTGQGFRLFSDIVEYHRSLDTQLNRRVALVEQAAGKSLRETYATLSAHIHGQSTYTVPKANEMKELVLSPAFLKSLVSIQNESGMMLSNYLVSVYVANWADLPPEIVSRVTAMFSIKQKQSFFGLL